jgi:hypothetical protein
VVVHDDAVVAGDAGRLATSVLGMMPMPTMTISAGNAAVAAEHGLRPAASPSKAVTAVRV